MHYYLRPSQSHFHATDTSTFQILTGEVELKTRSEFLSVAATLPFHFTQAFVTDLVQTVILKESSSVRLDWLKWVTEHPVVGGLVENTTFVVRRTQLDEYRNPLGPPREVTPQDRNRVWVNPEEKYFYVQVTVFKN